MVGNLLSRLTLLGVFFLSLPLHCDDLNALQEKISVQHNLVEETTLKSRELEKEVKALEEKIFSLGEEEKKLQQHLSQTQSEHQQIKKEHQALQQQMGLQKKQLAKIVTTIYQARLNPSLLEHLFSKEAKKTQIAQHYWRYLSRQKQQALMALTASENALIEKEERLTAQQQQLEQEQHALDVAQNEQQKMATLHQATLKKLQAQLTAEKKQLDELIAHEKSLRAKIEKAKREASKLAVKRQQQTLLAKANLGLGGGKKQFAFPIKGKVIHHFGTPQLGELHWRGIVIQASKDEKVKAIYPGQVIFAGRLAGYGEMVILKHGKYDLSLYGYNQKLLVNTGDMVDSGQEIALVGQINGKKEHGLYFEISRRGEPHNPLQWLH